MFGWNLEKTSMNPLTLVFYHMVAACNLLNFAGFTYQMAIPLFAYVPLENSFCTLANNPSHNVHCLLSFQMFDKFTEIITLFLLLMMYFYTITPILIQNDSFQMSVAFILCNI